MKMKSIKGKVSYQQIGPGFWAIIGQDGHQYRPVNFPNQLKYDGKEVVVKMVPADEEMSVFMWGDAVEIVAFETLMP